MWICLTLLLLEPRLLPSPAQPSAAWETISGAYWVQVSLPGSLAQLWFVSATQACSVLNTTSDTGTLYAAPEPKGEGIWLLNQKEMRLFRVDQKKLTATDQHRDLPQFLTRQHPWLMLPWVQTDQGPCLVFFEGDQLLILPADPKLKARSLQVAPGSGQPGSLLNLQVFAQSHELFWSRNDQLFRFDPRQSGSQPIAQPSPKRRNMERATVLALADGQPAWFLYGGERGDLSSFGWSLAASTSGSGIVTRFGADFNAPTPRVFVFTIANNVRGQLWAGLTGNVKYQCTVLNQKGKTWTQTQTFSLKMAKPSDRDTAYAISWDSDLNQDGYGDLLACDEDNGLRLFLSRKDGSLDENPQKLGSAPQALLSLKNAVLEGSQTQAGWRLKRRTVP